MVLAIDNNTHHIAWIDILRQKMHHEIKYGKPGLSKNMKQ